jgi:hypothetical protein
MKVPPIAFLGVVEQGGELDDHVPISIKHDLIGLKNFVFSPIYPLSLRSLKFVFAIYDSVNLSGSVIHLKNSKNESLQQFGFKTQIIQTRTGEEIATDAMSGAKPTPLVFADFPSWRVVIIPISGNLHLHGPEHFNLVLQRPGVSEEEPIGFLVFGYHQAPPLTEEHKAAIRSNPLAGKSATMILSCKHCKSNITAYTALEKNDAHEENAIWQNDLPDLFRCECGRTEFCLKYLRESFHAVLGRTPHETDGVQICHHYEDRASQKVCNEFIALLNTAAREEQLQEFLANHPVLFHQFAPKKIFTKPAILNKCKADFALLRQDGSLLLIEIENARQPLVRKDGEPTAEFHHAFHQVQDWLRYFEHHRAACLECLNLKSEDVTRVVGIVIMGRERNHDPAHIQRLKWGDYGKNVSFQTYDDLLRALAGLIGQLSRL